MGDDIPSELRALANRHWPGQFTIIYKGQGYRIPDNPLITELVSELGPLWCTSANKSGEPPAKTVSELEQIFMQHLKNIIIIKNTCPTSNVNSTIYDFDQKKIIRAGKLTKEKLFS